MWWNIGPDAIHIVVEFRTPKHLQNAFRAIPDMCLETMHNKHLTWSEPRHYRCVFQIQTNTLDCLGNTLSHGMGSMHPHIHASTHPRIHASMHPCIYASTHTCIHASMHPRIHASMHICTRASVNPSIHLSVCPSTCTYVYVHAYRCTRVPRCIQMRRERTRTTESSASTE